MLLPQLLFRCGLRHTTLRPCRRCRRRSATAAPMQPAGGPPAAAGGPQRQQAPARADEAEQPAPKRQRQLPAAASVAIKVEAPPPPQQQQQQRRQQQQQQQQQPAAPPVQQQQQQQQQQQPAAPADVVDLTADKQPGQAAAATPGSMGTPAAAASEEAQLQALHALVEACSQRGGLSDADANAFCVAAGDASAARRGFDLLRLRSLEQQGKWREAADYMRLRGGAVRHG